MWHFNITYRQLLQGGVSAENQMRYVCACRYRSFVFSVIFLCLVLQSLFLGAFLFSPHTPSFFLHENIPIMCQSNTPQGIQPHLSASCQVKYLQFVESITQYDVHLRKPYDLKLGGKHTWVSFIIRSYAIQQHYGKKENPSFFISKVLRIRK